MKFVYAVSLFFTFGLGLYLGGMIEHRTHKQTHAEAGINNAWAKAR